MLVSCRVDLSHSRMNTTGANQHVWHVLEIQPGSPAETSGLTAFSDYIIGADSVLQESEDLFTLIEAHVDKPLKLFVYNFLSDSCREVTIIPKEGWGGEGLLGCGIGYGYLHRIPSRPVDELKEKQPLLSSSGDADQHHQQQVINGDQGKPSAPVGYQTPDQRPVDPRNENRPINHSSSDPQSVPVSAVDTTTDLLQQKLRLDAYQPSAEPPTSGPQVPLSHDQQLRNQPDVSSPSGGPPPMMIRTSLNPGIPGMPPLTVSAPFVPNLTAPGSIPPNLTGPSGPSGPTNFSHFQSLGHNPYSHGVPTIASSPSTGPMSQQQQPPPPTFVASDSRVNYQQVPGPAPFIPTSSVPLSSPPAPFTSSSSPPPNFMVPKPVQRPLFTPSNVAAAPVNKN